MSTILSTQYPLFLSITLIIVSPRANDSKLRSSMAQDRCMYAALSPLMCGVRTTLGRSHSGLSLGSGSGSDELLVNGLGRHLVRDGRSER